MDEDIVWSLMIIRGVEILKYRVTTNYGKIKLAKRKRGVMGILYEEKILIKPYGSNIKHYQDKGYQFQLGETIEVLVKDSPEGTKIKVPVQCDCCGEIFWKEYKAAIKSVKKHNGKIYCKECYDHNKALSEYRQQKQSVGVQEKYGVCNIFQVSEIKTQIKQTCVKKYGKPSPMQVDFIQEKAAQTNLIKYGFRVALNNQEIYAKAQASLYEHGTQKCSSQQYQLFELIKEIYPEAIECKLNKPVSTCSADIALILDTCKIDIEYDGGYWHQDKAKDRRRDEFFKSQGYRVIRIKGNKTIPNKEELVQALNKLIIEDYKYTELILPDYSEEP